RTSSQYNRNLQKQHSRKPTQAEIHTINTDPTYNMNGLWQPTPNPSGGPGATAPTSDLVLNQEEILGRWNQISDHAQMKNILNVLSKRVTVTALLASSPPDYRRRVPVTKILCIGPGSLARATKQRGGVAEGPLCRLKTLAEVYKDAGQRALGPLPHPPSVSLPRPVTVVQTDYKAYVNTLSAIRFAKAIEEAYISVGDYRSKIEVVLCDSAYTEADSQFFDSLQKTTGVNVRISQEVPIDEEFDENTLLISFADVAEKSSVDASVILAPGAKESRKWPGIESTGDLWEEGNGMGREMGYLNTRFLGCMSDVQGLHIFLRWDSVSNN
ncbi:uncharacterized protein EI97DRAFT_481815, partial [Westerdykella ornata]